MPAVPAFLKNPTLLLTITAMLWAGNVVFGKAAVDHISPMVLTFMRWAIALAVIAVVGRHHIRKDWPVLKSRWRYLFVMGGFGYCVFNIMLYSALRYTSPVNATIEQSATPLFIFVLNFPIFRTLLTGLQAFGYALTVAGVVICATYGEPLKLFSAGTGVLNRGDVLVIVSALIYALYSVSLRARPDVHWISFLAALIAGSLVCSTVAVSYEIITDTAIWPTTLIGIGTAVYAGLFPSLLSQGFFMVGVAAIGANRAGLYVNIVPVFAALFAVLFLDEQLFAYHAIAFILVVGGVMLAQRTAAAPTPTPRTPAA